MVFASSAAISKSFRDGRRIQAVGLTLLLVLGLLAFAPSSAAAAPYRAFSAPSYWNQPLPSDAPVDRNSANILQFLKNDSTTNFVRFSGTGSSGNWGNPIYWASPSDTTYAVSNSCGHKMPPEFQSVRIPASANGDPTADGAMTVYDVDKGLVYAFRHASFSSNKWSSCGGTAYYLNSNGLDGILAESDEIRNFGHRGVPPPTYAVRYDEVSQGAIDHVLKIAVHHTADEYVFPMTGHENGSSDPYAPPEGTRIRIKPSVNLSSLGLSPGARVVATALQKYGAVIGDQSGGQINLKVENTVAEGRGQLWSGVLETESLSSINLDMYEVIQLGYGSGPTSPPPPPPPTAPSVLTAAAVSDTRIDLSWTDNSTAEDGFKIERSPNGTSDWAEVGTLGPNLSSFSHTGLSAGTTHHYRVRAFNAVGGNSGYSNTASATTLSPPAAPSSLDATASSSSQINLVWVDNSATEDGFRIERSPNGTSDWAEIGTLGPNTSSFSHTGLSAGTTHHYRVRAFSTAGGNSGYSNTASATTLSPPAAPSSLDATASSFSQINLVWVDNSVTEDGFKIERSPNGTSGWTQIGTSGPNVSSFSDSGLSALTTYFYRVRAYNSGGNSGSSNVDSATTPAPPLLPGVTLYLHHNPSPPTANTTAKRDLSMNTAAPTATTLYKYSTDYYNSVYPGRYVERSSGSSSESNRRYMVNWVHQVTGPGSRVLSGDVKLNIWVAVKDFRCDRTLSFKVFLRDKSSATTSSGSTFETVTTTFPSPNPLGPIGSCGFRLTEVTVPVSPSRTIAVGRWLEVKVTVNTATGYGGLFAYDTTANASLLKLP